MRALIWRRWPITSSSPANKASAMMIATKATIIAPAIYSTRRRLLSVKRGSLAIDQRRERDDPTEHGQDQEAIGQRQRRRRARTLLDQRDLEIAQHPGDDERRGEIEVRAADAAHHRRV